MEPRQPELEESSTATVDGVLKSVEAPSDGEGCSICLGQGGQRPRERRRCVGTSFMGDVWRAGLRRWEVAPCVIVSFKNHLVLQNMVIDVVPSS